MSEDLKFILIPLGIVIAIVSIIAIPVVSLEYYSNCRQVKIINQKYGTDYSCGDMFWAGKQINQEIRTIRVEGELPVYDQKP